MDSLLDSLLPQCLHILSREKAAEDSTLLVVPTEPLALELSRTLRDLGGSPLLFPGVIQLGVARYEGGAKDIAKRLRGVWEWGQGSVAVATPLSLARSTPSASWLLQNRLLLRAGQESDPDELLERLTILAYRLVPYVREVGEVSLRGGILDLWSPACPRPTRLEFGPSAIVAMREFLPATQVSVAPCAETCVLPAREFLWPRGEALERAQERLQLAMLAAGLSGTLRVQFAEHLTHGVDFPGLDDASRLFTPAHSSLLEVLGAPRAFLIGTEALWTRAAGQLTRLLETTPSNRVPEPSAASVLPGTEGTLSLLASAPSLRGQPGEFGMPDPLAASLEKVAQQAPMSRMEGVLAAVTAHKIRRLCLTAPTLDAWTNSLALWERLFPSARLPEGGLPRLDFSRLKAGTWEPGHLGGLLFGCTSPLSAPLFDKATSALLLPEAWLLGASHKWQEVAPTPGSHPLIAAFGEFSPGDLVVHVQYGIARFLGLSTIEVAGTSADFLVLEYQSADKVYVPVHHMNLVQRYVGGGEENIDALRSGKWQKRKARAKEDASRLAAELMEAQARRAMAAGYAFPPIDADYLSFEAAFEHVETPDQRKALGEIASDMGHPRPMDRLLCGDVGFGKTEVAMRAAYRAILGGKQVAWLVPTTVLAHQHARTLRERFQGFPVSTALFDRSIGPQGTRVTEAMRSGSLDLVIGTHKLLSKEVAFRDLGLVVVDEEQRFGVVQKEKIKALARGADVLTLSATPIPRTLQLAMMGLRDLSLLSTAPRARLPVKTVVCPFDLEVIGAGIAAERSRGGQIFYVHNKVEELASIKETLERTCPGLRVVIGHGKMSQPELEKAILAFLAGSYDCLLCTTIIESGIDMPQVNTIFVQNADQFGLSQLYQLRGRVGRRSSQGYAYLLHTPDADPESSGMARLQVLEDHQDLGAGFAIATSDLDLRGAGDILGDHQSGRVKEVGLETYSQLLEEAMGKLGGRRFQGVANVDMQLPVQGHIPDTYLADSKERLRLYRRFYGAGSETALQGLVDECSDRFGPPPEEVILLADLARVRRHCMLAGIVSLVAGVDCTEGRLAPEILGNSGLPGTELLVKRILDVCNRSDTGLRLRPDGRLVFPVRRAQLAAPGSPGLQALKQALSRIQQG